MNKLTKYLRGNFTKEIAESGDYVFFASKLQLNK